MATRTSTQSGKFTSTSTWGGNAAPVDGDSFIVAEGHIVEIDNDQRKTNGFADSYVRGKLWITSGGKIRMNGVLYVENPNDYAAFFAEGVNSGGFLRMENNTVMEIRGANSDNHHLQMRSQRYITIEFEGSQKNALTTTTSAKVIGNTTFDVSSSSGFAVGDWVNVYQHQTTASSGNTTNYQYGHNDEGIIIHDISGNTIYWRHFVSPTSDIVAVGASTIQVENAKVFRRYQSIIFGTGSNRNVKTIDNINYKTNRITLNSSISGSVVGETVYTTGCDFTHVTSSQFEKMATPLTADAAQGATTITVASTQGMSNGDEISLPNTNLEVTDTYNFQQRYTISSISGNTITLTEGLARAYKTGNWCAIWTHDCVFQGVDATQRVFFYCIYWNSSNSWYRRIKLRNCVFRYIGGNTNSSVYRGFYLRGRHSFRLSDYGQYESRLENVRFACDSDYSNNDYKRVAIGESGYYGPVVRGCHFTETYRAYITWGYERMFSNNMYWRLYYGVQIDGWYSPRNQLKYNLIARAGSYGTLWYHGRNCTSLVFQNYWLCHHNRAMYHYYGATGFKFTNCYFDGYRYWDYNGAGSGCWVMVNCYRGNDWDITGNSRIYSDAVNLHVDGNAYGIYGNQSIMTSTQHNFEVDGLAQWGSSSALLRIWDHDDRCWRCYNDRDDNYQGAGFLSNTFLPAGTKIMIKCTAMNLSTNTTAPYLVMYMQGDYDLGSYRDWDGTGSRVTHTNPITTAGGADRFSAASGFYKRSQFPSWTKDAWVTHSLTLEPLKKDVTLVVGLLRYSPSSADPGWKEKPLQIMMSGRHGPYTAAQAPFIGNFAQTPVNYMIKESTTDTITRIGGRIG